jgi:hypothetical protein
MTIINRNSISAENWIKGSKCVESLRCKTNDYSTLDSNYSGALS